MLENHNQIVKLTKLKFTKKLENGSVHQLVLAIDQPNANNVKYYYQVKDNLTNIFAPIEVTHFTKRELIEDALQRIDDDLIDDFPEFATERAIITCKRLDFDKVRFPILQRVYQKDGAKLTRVVNLAELEPETIQKGIYYARSN